MTPSPGGPTVGQLAAALLDLVVPQECAGCGHAGVVWCSACRSATTGTLRSLAVGIPGAAAAEHAGPLGRAVVEYKDAGQRRLAGPLAWALADAVRGALAAPGPAHCVPGARAVPVWLVPVPSRPEARRRRGTDHIAVLAARAARELRRSGWVAHRCRLLHHVATSRDQVGLGREQRLSNLAGTMAALPPPAGILVVVDDVTTTGATLKEATRALRVASRGSMTGPGADKPWPILAATITVATRVRGHASGPVEH